MPKQAKKETYTLSGDKVVKKVKELVKEGNIRKITITDKDNKQLFVIPMTWGILGVLASPALAALGVIVALLTECKIHVERN